MLKRRLIAAIAALILAGVGAVLLSSYVRGADQRAMSGMVTVNTLTVTSLIRQGTSADALTKLVTRQAMPVKAVPQGAISSLSDISGQVATTDLQPGEQLLASRFATPASLEDANAVKIPAGMQQVTVPIERPRMLGSMLIPGASVGVFMSTAREGNVPVHTDVLLHRALVTQVGDAAPASDSSSKTSQPEATVTVTFALSARDAERLVFGAEFGRLWLSLEPPGANVSGTGRVDAGNVSR